MGDEILKINIREVFKKKNPGIARLLPGFLYKYLEKVIHQDDINDILNRFGHKYGVEFVDDVINDFKIKLNVKGFENVPSSGRFIFACNHPLGGFDALLLISYLNQRGIKTKTLVNDILMNIPNLRPLFIPLNKHGKQNPESAIQLENTYQSDYQIVTFPSGLVSRKINGQIIDLVWKKNFIVKSVQYKRDVIPVFISGRNSEFFYRLARIRKAIGIKSNIEMFYLSDETFNHKNKEFNIIFGKPITYTVFDRSKKPSDWAKWVKQRVYELNGVYEIPF